MAVTLKGSGESWASLLVMLGVGNGIVEKAIAQGVIIEQTSPGTFLVKDSLDHVHGVIPVKGQAITLAKEGKLGPASKQALQFQFTQAIEKAVTASPLVKGSFSSTTNPGIGKLDIGPSTLKVDGSSNLTVPAPGYKNAVKPVIASGTSDGTIVNLNEAKEIYQKVFGTSSNSIYVVCVLFKDMGMAIRKKGSKLSVRVEGDLPIYSNALNSVGFEIHSGYGSVHLNIIDKALLKKTIGAIVGAVGLTEVVAVGDVEKAIALCQ